MDDHGTTVKAAAESPSQPAAATRDDEDVDQGRSDDGPSGNNTTTEPTRANPDAHLQILGLLPDGASLRLTSQQLRGNRQLLLSTPDAVSLYIRPNKRPIAGTGNHPVTVAWRLHNGKQFPDVAAIAPSSPTLLLGRTPRGTLPCRNGNGRRRIPRQPVYPSLRHALVSLLLWSLGGMTGALVYHVPPGTPKKNSKDGDVHRIMPVPIRCRRVPQLCTRRG